MAQEEIVSTGCCERFDPEPWQEKEIVWKEKKFVKDHVREVLHIPVNMGKVITDNMALIEKAGAKSPYQLMLVDEDSAWGSDLYIDVAKDVPGAEMAVLSGTFLSKVFEGPYQSVGKWMEEMEQFVQSRGKVAKKIYTSYTTCPNCAKAYGKNYVVLFAQID